MKIKHAVDEERKRLHSKNAVDPSVNSQAELELREELLRVQEEKNASLKKEKEIARQLEESKATVESLKSRTSQSDQKSQTLMDLTNQAERAKAEANATLKRAQKIEEEAMRNADRLHEMEQQLLEAEEIDARCTTRFKNYAEMSGYSRACVLRSLVKKIIARSMLWTRILSPLRFQNLNREYLISIAYLTPLPRKRKFSRKSSP